MSLRAVFISERRGFRPLCDDGCRCFQVIEVTFGKFDVERDVYCRYDYVAFYNGGERDASRSIGKYCGDQAPE